jgi:hypothetical protein
MAERALRKEKRASGVNIELRLRDLFKLRYGIPLKAPFCEYLMGWVLRWTDLEPLEMGKFLLWLEQHGVYSVKD